ncbi:MAG: glycosyltransferase [Propionibacteriaceae bacterium]|nr:glycosyltransferase [Propionibacteriaceae bacterium]
MKASVVIPSRGGRERLPVLLRALEAQTYPDWEAIVVIDGDIDDSASVVANFSYLPVRCIVLPENKGRVTALNTGFAAATGDVLIRADDDFEPSPGHVAAHVAAHADEPCGAVGLPRNIADDNAYMRAYGLWADEVGRAAGYATAPHERWRLWGGNVSCTRETYDRVGGYDTSYRGYGWEDVDFGYRLYKLGLPIALLPEAEVRHHMASVTTRIRALRAFDSGRARSHFESLHGAGTAAPVTPRDTSLWNKAVALVSRLPGRRSVELVSNVADKILPAIPPKVGRKVVALIVEAAGVSGSRSNRVRQAVADVVFMPGIAMGGGAERYAVSLAASLRDMGRQPIIATTDDVSSSYLESHFGIDAEGIGLVRLAELPAWASRLPRAVADVVRDVCWVRQLRRLRPNLFVNSLYKSELPGLGARNLYVIHFPHQIVRCWSPAWRNLYMQAVRSVRGVLAGAADFRTTYDLLAANSEFTAGHVHERWGKRAEILYPPCPVIGGASASPERRIIVVGRMEPPVRGVPNKRLDVLVSAFAELTDLHATGWSLDVVGACRPESEPYLAELREAAGEAPVNFYPNASFEQLATLYRQATLYWHAQGFGEESQVAPETQEHFGITTVEAMSAGCIPVVIDTAGPREVVAPVAGAGRWTSVAQLQAETRRIAGLPAAERADIAVRCMARAKEFSPQRFTERLVRLVS